MTDGFFIEVVLSNRPRSCELFNASVLELVKLIQASLAIFGMFDVSTEERNGLLCDVTRRGLETWLSQLGDHLQLEVGLSTLGRIQ